MSGENENAGKAGLIVGGLAGVLAIIAMAKKASAAPGSTFSLDEATRQLLIAIAEANVQLVADVEAILQKMTTSSGGGLSGYPVANAISMRSITLTFNVANKAVILPSIKVPDDMDIVVKADPGNAVGSIVRVAENEANAIDPVNSYPLIPNEFRAVRIQDASKLWVSATVLPAAVIVSAEQR